MPGDVHDPIRQSGSNLCVCGATVDDPVRTASPAPDPEVTIYIAQVLLSILPEDHDDARAFSIGVERLLHDRWRIRRPGNLYLQADGTWKRWADGHSFEYLDALRRAREALPLITVNGKRAVDLLAVAGGDDPEPPVCDPEAPEATDG